MLCLRYSHSRVEAEDFLQESFLKIFSDLHQYDPDKGALYTWMRRVTINTALQILRKKKMQFVDMEDVSIDSVKHESFDPVDGLNLSDLYELIQKLPDGYRTIFNLYEIEGYSHQEISEMLDISPGTSRSQFFKARKMLRELITEVTIENKKSHVDK